MKMISKEDETYTGFEQGPIRPPSEAQSLLFRVTRNCPWNHCSFCPVYKGKTFSRRPVSHVKQDMDMLHKYVEMIREQIRKHGRINQTLIQEMGREIPSDETDAFYAALNWFGGGMESVFIQDANSLIIKPADLVEILLHLRKRFPWVKRITSYARSGTLARISDEDMKAIAEAGLNRIHVGMESGSDAVLKKVRKGATKEVHIRAGQKVKQAGMELSEYVMPGLGGKSLSENHALETADAINRINPDFIRLRTLALPKRAPLFREHEKGNFDKCGEVETAQEILLFIEHLDGITSTLTSDHILNLFQDVAGKFPEDRPRMTGILRRFLDMDPESRCFYMVGRRMGIFHSLVDMKSPHRMKKVETFCREHQITPENVDHMTAELMKRFI